MDFGGVRKPLPLSLQASVARALAIRARIQRRCVGPIGARAWAVNSLRPHSPIRTFGACACNELVRALRARAGSHTAEHVERWCTRRHRAETWLLIHINGGKP